ncbi:hypothetical protein [Kouleothrix sp.]|uniref:hypothetical protein n=1 Tax=Kouleothrix sp. TaxID=2779161 RepID=UPI0039190BCB
MATRERPLTPAALVPHEGVISPYTTNANPYITPIWRDCTPARLALGVSVLTTNNGSNYWTITLSTISPAGAIVAQGSVTTAALGPNLWLPLGLTTFATARWLASAISLAYLTIAKTGAPGALGLAPALYVL